MNDFLRDDAFQREIRDQILAPQFYQIRAFEGRYVFMDKGKLATILQKRFAIDTVLQSRDGTVISIEEKIVRWKGRKYDHLCIETDSCTVEGYKSDGWIKYGNPDYLLYCFQLEDESLECWLIDFEKLKTYYEKFGDCLPRFRMKNTINKTEGVLAPLSEIRSDLKPSVFKLNEKPPF